MDHPPGIIEHLLAWGVGCMLPVLTLIYNRRFSGNPPNFQMQAEKIRFYRSNSLFLFGIGALTLLVWMIRGRPLSDLGFRMPPRLFTSTFNLFLIIFTSLFLIDLLFSFAGNVARKRTAAYQEKYIPFIPGSSIELKWYMLMCIAAGLGEEIFFRGFLINYVRTFLPLGERSEFAAVLLPAFFFSLGHAYQGAKAIIKIFLFALLFGFMYTSSGSLYPLIAIHSLVDLLNGWFSMYLPKMQANGKIRKLG